MIDAIVIGAGPNGLVAAIEMAKKGWKVLVLEAKERPGGALYSIPCTRPGFVHDVGAAFFPFAIRSPALRSLELEKVGLEWANGIYESSHPAPDGSCASISRDIAKSIASFGVDGKAWEKFQSWANAICDPLVQALMAPIGDPRPVLRLGLQNLFKLGVAGLSSVGSYSKWHFASEAARRVLPALALHADLGPNDFASTPIGLVLAITAATDGFRFPVGGAKSITDAMLKRLEESGGQVKYHGRVKKIVVRNKRGQAVITEDGEEIPCSKAIVADVGAPALYLKLIDRVETPDWLIRSIKRFRYAWGTFKMDWALNGPVPWHNAEVCQAAVVHTGDNLSDLASFTKQVRRGEIPNNPYLVIGQQSLFDTQRAPEGKHTLWAYSHVPSFTQNGWQVDREYFADRIEERLEGLAGGFKQCIIERASWSPEELERMDENLVGGDLGGGSAQLDHALIFRPTFPYFRYRTHLKNVYLGSASTHPGAGVHGACGFNAAQIALQDAKVV